MYQTHSLIINYSKPLEEVFAYFSFNTFMVFINDNLHCIKVTRVDIRNKPSEVLDDDIEDKE